MYPVRYHLSNLMETRDSITLIVRQFVQTLSQLLANAQSRRSNSTYLNVIPGRCHGREAAVRDSLVEKVLA